MSDVIVTDSDDPAEGAAEVAQITAVSESASNATRAEIAQETIATNTIVTEVAADTATNAADASLNGAATAVIAADQAQAASSETLMAISLLADQVGELRAAITEMKIEPSPPPVISTPPVEDTPPQRTHFLQRRIGGKK